LGLLGGLQGAIGWWMVVSGLVGRVDVSPIRLATHLGVAFTILGYGAWLALKELGWPKEPCSGGPQPKWIAWLLAALFVQIVLGALTAGSHAGRAFPDWPTIGGAWIPTYAKPFASNFTQNLATIQFHHRTMGYLVFVGLIAAAFVTRRRAHGPVRKVCVAAAHIASLQVMLGIGAVMMGAPLWISLIHQGVAILLWLSLVAWLRAAYCGTPVPHAQTEGAQGSLQT
jgi:cytochrome c oxidase assembly protein subunit 15